MKHKLKKIISAGALALCLAMCAALCSCADASDGKTFHTLFVGDGIQDPETVIITVPGETVIITVPVEQTTVPEETTKREIVTTKEEENITTAPAATETEVQTSVTPGYSYQLKTVTHYLDTKKNSYAMLIYPQLENTGNELAESRVNALIAELALSDFTGEESCKDYSDKISAGINVTYKMMSSEVTMCGANLLSLRWEGVYELSDNSDTVNIISTHLINMSTGKEIKKKNVFSDFAAVLDMMEKGDFTLGKTAGDFSANLNLSEKIAEYRSGILYGKMPELYFTDDSLVIIVELDTKGVNYGEYVLPRERVATNVKIAF